jgi:tRNA-dihydrouridine synthase
MEGLLDWIMRDILSRVGGADLCFTEFVRVTGTLLPHRVFMIGRGAIANPALARIIREGGGEPLAWNEILGLLRGFWDTHVAHTPSKHRCGRVKQWLSYLREAYPEAEARVQNLARRRKS